MVELRKYQEDAISAILGQWEQGYRHTLLVLPTGTGKTIVFAKITEIKVNGGKRVLILAHRSELLSQAGDKLKQVTGLDACLEKAESKAAGSSLPVTIGSVQTLAIENRLTQFPRDYFDVIVVDEAHHAMSDSYQRILQYFNTAEVLGVTATPDRSDRKNLGQYFDSLAYEYTLARAIREGYLSPIKAQLIPLELDITDVGYSNGDYAVNQLGDSLEKYLYKIAEEMVNYCKGRKTLVFLPLVKISQNFCQILNDMGFRAAEVNCNSKDREEVLKDFDDGKYDVLCNSMLLTEGYDSPSIDCVVILRPTKIRSLYQQMVGRGTRLAPGKTELLLLDFLWMTQKHDLCRPSSLISKDGDIDERITKKIASAGGGMDLIEANDEAEKDVVREREEALARELEASRKKRRELVDPIQYIYSIAAEDLADYEPTFAWESGPATQKQIDYLQKHGIFAEEIPNCGYASMLIDKLRRRQEEGLATPKQIRFLERMGFLHVGLWPFDDATRIISWLNLHNWRLPRGFDPKTYVPKGVTL